MNSTKDSERRETPPGGLAGGVSLRVKSRRRTFLSRVGMSLRVAFRLAIGPSTKRSRRPHDELRHGGTRLLGRMLGLDLPASPKMVIDASLPPIVVEPLQTERRLALLREGVRVPELPLVVAINTTPLMECPFSLPIAQIKNVALFDRVT